MNRNKCGPQQGGFSVRMRRLAWLNIAVQMAFPLAGAFTPAIAGMNHEQHLLKQTPGTVAGQPTTVHTLTTGETVATVAKKYHMSVDELRQLNALRTFAHGFDHLQPGDDLDVPVAPLATVTWDTRQTTGSASDTRAEDPAMQVASAASQAGGFLANHPDSDAAASMARGMASGAASEAAQQWLSRFGTARVQLDTDEHFSLKNSQLDLLAPLYDSQTGLLFTQGSVHRTDDRSQTNLGLGYRWFNDGWMLGMNTFWDNDWSHNHTRGGVGMEYWRDFLKVSANDYFRLSGWKDSPDVEDYQERPANGWDVRLQGWLPALPQLGGKLVYEQYYGDEVALFDEDNRQRNPHAITAGLTYTPVPLLTFSAEQRQGESGENDTRFGVEMNYQLGIPWRQQLDPAGVAALRTLNGSRYDLVERNNNIVLEYRRKEVIRLRMADLVTGHGGENKSLGVSVTSKYGVDHIDWTAPALLAAGGKIVANGGSDYSVVLPVWQSAPSAVNNYTVSAVAVDTKGNRSERSQTQVTVQKPDISQQNSTLTPVQSTLPADGRTTETLTLTIKDGNGAPEDVALADIHISTTQKVTAVQGTQDITVSDPVRKNTGVYEMTVTAGTKAETATVSATVDNVAVKPVTIAVNSTAPSERHSAIKTDSTTYVSGSDMLITVTLKDAQDNAVTGAASSLTVDVTVPNATLKTGSRWQDNGDGTYTGTYTATTAGTGLKAKVKLSGWGTATKSEAYAITEPVTIKGVSANGYTFKKDAGFPTTGFKGGWFTLVLSGGSASDFNWRADASWVSVNNGVVSFTGTGNGKKVTITGTPTSGQGETIKYSFTLKSWFINRGKTLANWSEAGAYCTTQSGYSLATVQQLNGGGTRGALGGLWSEWGNLLVYGGTGFSGYLYWSSEQKFSGFHNDVSLRYGLALSYDDSVPNYVVCRQGL